MNQGIKNVTNALERACSLVVSELRSATKDFPA